MNVRRARRVVLAALVAVSALGTATALPARPSAAARATPPAPRVAGWLNRHLPATTRQAVVVAAVNWTTTYGEFTAWRRSGTTWVLAHTPVTVRLGSAGLALPYGESIPGTPAGVFGVGTAFGWYANPATRLGWRVTTRRSVWVDDPRSRYYNTWQEGPARGRWRSAERLRIPVYRYALLIATNPRRTPYLGSAVFLHITDGRPTAGCVAGPSSLILWALRWLNPRQNPRFVMEPTAALARR